jgi:hypothetical protein
MTDIIKYEGKITKVGKRTFKADLITRNDIANMTTATFKKSLVPENQQDKIVEGAIFDWTIDEIQEKEKIIMRETVNWKDFDLNAQSNVVDSFMKWLEK